MNMLKIILCAVWFVMGCECGGVRVCAVVVDHERAGACIALI